MMNMLNVSMRRMSNRGALAATLVLAACSTQNAARFERTGTLETFPVTVVAVDGLPHAGGAASMEPGQRKLTVQMPRAAGFREGETRVFELDVKACTQYWLVAQRDTRSSQDFDIRVDHSRRVGTCSAGIAAKPAATPANTPLDAPAKPSASKPTPTPTPTTTTPTTTTPVTPKPAS